MLPSWVTWDHCKDIVQGVGYLAALWYTHRRTTKRLDRQDHELKKQSVGIEWNNEATEMIASGAVTIPPPAVITTPLPPRPKVASQVDIEAELVAEAAKKR